MFCLRVQNMFKWHIGSIDIVTQSGDSQEDQADNSDWADESYMSISSYVFMVVCACIYTVCQTFHKKNMLNYKVSQSRIFQNGRKKWVSVMNFSLCYLCDRIFPLKPAETTGAFLIDRQEDVRSPLSTVDRYPHPALLDLLRLTTAVTKGIINKFWV